MEADVRFLNVSFIPFVPPGVGAGVIPATGVLVQLNVVPAVSEEGVYVNAVLLQTSAGVRVLFNTGVGLTVIVKLCGVPAHPSNEGVTVIVDVTGAVPEFVAVNEGILPVPLAPRPMLVLLFDHA